MPDQALMRRSPGREVICIRREPWRDTLGLTTGGPAYHSEWTVAAVGEYEGYDYFRLKEWGSDVGFLATEFRPLPSIDSLRQLAARVEQPLAMEG
jgi:hypothetical protein